MMGIPEEDEAEGLPLDDVMLGFGDDEVSGEFDEVVEVVTEIAEYGVASRRGAASAARGRPHDEPGARRGRR